jgi:hypothetical protein
VSNKTNNNTTYSDALEKAKQELAQCELQIRELDGKRAKLRQTISVLASLTGVEVTQERTLTESVLLAVTALPGYSTAVQVTEMLVQTGNPAQHASVAAILSRSSKLGKIGYSVNPDNGVPGYTSVPETTKAERIQAQRTLAGK